MILDMNTEEKEEKNLQNELQGEVSKDLNETQIGDMENILPSTEVIDIVPKVIQEEKE
jgi:hypothetical protein